MSREQDSDWDFEIIGPVNGFTYTHGLFKNYDQPEVFFVTDSIYSKFKSEKLQIDLVRIFAIHLIMGKIDYLTSEIRRATFSYQGDSCTFHWWPASPEVKDSYSEQAMHVCIKSYGKEFPALQVLTHTTNMNPYFYQNATWTEHGCVGLGTFPYKNYLALQFHEHFSQACENVYCSKKGVNFCSGCKQVRYCSSSCSKKYWSEHKAFCYKDPLGFGLNQIFKSSTKLPFLMSSWFSSLGFEWNQINQLMVEGTKTFQKLSVLKCYNEEVWMVSTIGEKCFLAKPHACTSKGLELEKIFFDRYVSTLQDSDKIDTDRPTFVSMYTSPDPYKNSTSKDELRMFLLLPLEFGKLVTDKEQAEFFFPHFLANYFDLREIDFNSTSVFQFVALGKRSELLLPPWHPESGVTDPYRDFHPHLVKTVKMQLDASCGKPFCINTTLAEEKKHPCIYCRNLIYCSQSCMKDDYNRHRFHCRQNYACEEFTDIYEMD